MSQRRLLRVPLAIAVAAASCVIAGAPPAVAKVSKPGKSVIMEVRTGASYRVGSTSYVNITVFVAAPASNGGAAIKSTRVTGGGKSCRFTGGTGKCVLRKIKVGKVIAMRAYAKNRKGTGKASTKATYKAATNSDRVFSAGPAGQPSPFLHQIGSSASDRAESVLVDAAGNVYVTGNTYGSLLDLTPGSGGSTRDAFVAKYGPNGVLQWARQFGNVGDEYTPMASLGTDGFLYLGGTVSGSFMGNEGVGADDIYAARMSPSDGTMMWTTQIGTTAHDRTYGMVIGNGVMYVGGASYQSMPSAIQAHHGDGSLDAFITRLSLSDGTVINSTMVGAGGFDDYIEGLAVTPAGHVVAVGETYGQAFGMAGHTDGCWDGIAMQYTADLTTQLWGTQYNCNPPDQTGMDFYDVAVDAAGDLFVAGDASGGMGTEAGVGDWDATVIKLSGVDGGIMWARVLGTPGYDSAAAIALHGGSIYLVANVTGDVGGYVSQGTSDIVVAIYTSSGTRTAVYGVGSVKADYPSDIAVTSTGRIAIAGLARDSFGGQVASGSDDIVVGVNPWVVAP